MADEKTTTTKQIAEQIIEESAVNPADIPHLTKFVDSRNAIWSFGGEVPNSKNWLIMSMFRDGEDVRVYAAPTREKDDKGEPVPFARFTLSRDSSHSCVLIESMSLSVFKSEIAADLVRVAEESGLTEETVPEPTPNGASAEQPTS